MPPTKKTMTGFSGYRCHICDGDRFNRKTLTTLWEDVVEDETNNQGAVAQMMDRVKGEKSLQSA